MQHLRKPLVSRVKKPDCFLIFLFLVPSVVWLTEDNFLRIHVLRANDCGRWNIFMAQNCVGGSLEEVTSKTLRDLHINHHAERSMLGVSIRDQQWFQELMSRGLPTFWRSHLSDGGIHTGEVVSSPLTSVASSYEETVFVYTVKSPKLGAVIQKREVL